MGTKIQLFITIVLLFCSTIGYSQEKDSMLVYKDKKGATRVSMSIYKFTEFYKAKKAVDSVSYLVNTLSKDLDSLKSNYRLSEELSKKQLSLLSQEVADKNLEIEAVQVSYIKKEEECFETQKKLGQVKRTRNKFIFSTVILLSTTILYTLR